jgi:phosphoglycolate phosphatase-like HAD superfamily hydrolase
LPTKYLNNYKTIFWDFDGVIKESLEIKSDAFEQLFRSFGENISKKIRFHHERNGGISRFDKLPIYIKWSGQKPTKKNIQKYEEKFSCLVKQKVINSDWVPGVVDYLSSNYKIQNFFLITATPQNEIEEIIKKLKIKHFFKKVIGSPIRKDKAIKSIIIKNPSLFKKSIMVGDSISDYNAADGNNMQFVLRRTLLNRELQTELKCLMIDNFL